MMFYSISAKKGDGGRNQQFGGGAPIETQIGANIDAICAPCMQGKNCGCILAA